MRSEIEFVSKSLLQQVNHAVCVSGHTMIENSINVTIHISEWDALMNLCI